MGHILERCSTIVLEKIKGLFYNSSYKPFKHFWKYSKTILNCSRIIKEHLKNVIWDIFIKGILQ